MRITPLALLLTSLIVLTHGLPALDVGDKAPALTSAAWVKNGPADVGKGLLLVEFWATWCGPCKTTIPHLTKLGKRYGDKLTIAGLSSEEEEVVKPFVTAQGPAMDYHVGVADEALNQSYMEGRDGIPFSFLIGADGVVLWVGHPMEIEPVLAAVVAGTFDAKAASLRAKKHQELQELLQQDPGADQEGFLAKVSAQAAALLKDDPSDEMAFQVSVGVAKHRKDSAGVRTVLASLPIAQLSGSRAAELAITISGDPAVADRNLDIAWALADRAVSAAPTEANSHLAAARVRYALGMLEEAILAQEQAAKREPELAADLLFYREALRLRDLAKAGKPLTAPAVVPASAKPVPEIKTMAPPAADANTVP